MCVPLFVLVACSRSCYCLLAQLSRLFVTAESLCTKRTCTSGHLPEDTPASLQVGSYDHSDAEHVPYHDVPRSTYARSLRQGHGCTPRSSQKHIQSTPYRCNASAGVLPIQLLLQRRENRAGRPSALFVRAAQNAAFVIQFAHWHSSNTKNPLLH